MATVQLAGNGFGGLVQGNYGAYRAAADGTFTVDTRDAPSMLALGMSYVNKAVSMHGLLIAPAAATLGHVVASGALSDGAMAIAAQTDVPRQVTVEVGAGTLAVTAGTATVTYIGNDSQTDTDTFSLACPANGSTTQFLSRGALVINSVELAGVVGGAAPWFRMSTTATLALPISPGGADFDVIREYDAGATIAVGALASTLGGITPTTAPNGTVTYGFVYSFTAPNA